MKRLQTRQGDVFLCQVASLPSGATLVPLDRGRVILAHGEVTGHAHAIASHSQQIGETAAAEIVEALIARCKARLYEHDGNRYLVVDEPVLLVHEEHGAHEIPHGVYELPIQCEYDASTMRRVGD